MTEFGKTSKAILHPDAYYTIQRKTKGWVRQGLKSSSSLFDEQEKILSEGCKLAFVCPEIYLDVYPSRACGRT